MVKCPKCGSNVEHPTKTWHFFPRKFSKHGEKPKNVMGIFKCPNCNARFRTTLESDTTPKEMVSIKNMVEKIKDIRGELMQTLKNLREKIKTLETERANLMMEIEKLRKIAESKVVALESEVSMLREEVKSLRELLGYTEDLEK